MKKCNLILILFALILISESVIPQFSFAKSTVRQSNLYIALDPSDVPADLNSPQTTETTNDTSLDNVQPNGSPEPSNTQAAQTGVKATSGKKAIDNQLQNPAIETPVAIPVQIKPKHPKITTHPEKSFWATVRNVIFSWWSGASVNLRWWCLFFIVSLTVYLLKLKQLRKPLLFLSLIILGFFLKDPLDPIKAIFSILTKNWHVLQEALILLAIPIIISLFWGRFFCGWICPLGAVQEFLNPEQENRLIPIPLDQGFKYLKYLVLIGLGYLTWRTSINYWTGYEPFSTMFSFSGTTVTFLTLVGILLLSLMISRPFCRYLCPLGAILAITSKIAPFTMKTDAAKCMVCGKCLRGVCPMDAISSYNPEIDLPEISVAECIYCTRCQKVCPKSAFRITGFHINRVYYTHGQTKDES